MRYCIQPATSVDVAFLAAVMDENREQWTGEGEAVPIDRLLQTCACSAQIWAARDAQRQKRLEDKIRRQAKQLGYQLVPMKQKPAA